MPAAAVPACRAIVHRSAYFDGNGSGCTPLIAANEPECVVFAGSPRKGSRSIRGEGFASLPAM
jgi:hypothetical protein